MNRKSIINSKRAERNAIRINDHDFGFEVVGENSSHLILYLLFTKTAESYGTFRVNVFTIT